MFSKNLVIAVKVNGKVLREFDDTVALPFGSEYVIFLKNLSNKRVGVSVSVDGQNVLDGSRLIIRAHESVELKRFVTRDNLKVGNAFKFIEKTKKIEAYRGNKAEDGLITIQYEFEREKPKYTYSDRLGYYDSGVRSNFNDVHWSTLSDNVDWNQPAGYNKGILRSMGSVTTTSAGAGGEVYCATASINSNSAQYLQGNSTPTSYMVNDAGITAPGRLVERKFNITSDFISDGVPHTMTLKLVGANSANVQFTEAITVKKLIRCKMCGTHTKETAKFCHECGASVEVV